MKKGMMISCRDATELVVRKSAEKLNSWDRFRLKFHRVMCRLCRVFEQQNALIDQLAEELDEKDPMTMPGPAKEKALRELTK